MSGPLSGSRIGPRIDPVRPEQTGVAEVAAAALWADAAEAPLVVRRLADPPEGRRWIALGTSDLDGVVLASIGGPPVTDTAAGGGAASDVVAGHVDLLAVHPDAQGRGIGRALVSAAEDWLRAQGATDVRFAGNPPCYGWPGIDVRYTPAACLAESLGYERYRIAWNMTADLPVSSPEDETEPTRLAAAGVTVRAAPAGERAAVVEFVRRHWNEQWGWEAEQATGCHYAERDGEILGFAAWGGRPLWFGPMGTAEAARGLGVGRVLLRRCLDEQAAAGLRSVQIGWVGPIRFYSRAVAARVERVFWLYRRPLG